MSSEGCYETISDESIRAPATIAISPNQLASIAELSKTKRYALYEDVCRGNLQPYFDISCRPITKKAEDDMELVSDIATWGEKYLHCFENGLYRCARCSNPLYSSEDKWKGPCRWPSFRNCVQFATPRDNTHNDDNHHHPTSTIGISTATVSPYNNYSVEVREVYCGKCDLFIGHMFADGKAKGDAHRDAHWRH
jgi:peptide-methionine (R)-S-oxide reductase